GAASARAPRPAAGEVAPARARARPAPGGRRWARPCSACSGWRPGGPGRRSGDIPESTTRPRSLRPTSRTGLFRRPCAPGRAGRLRAMERTLEPEVMDTAEEADEYDAMDHAIPN